MPPAVVRAAQAVVPVPLALVAAAGLVASLQLSRLLGAARVREAAVLTARGRSRRTAARGVTRRGPHRGRGRRPRGLVRRGRCRRGDGRRLCRCPGPHRARARRGRDRRAASRSASPRGAPRIRRPPGTSRARGVVSAAGAALLLLAAAVFLWLLATLGRDAGEITADPWSLVVVALAPALGLAAVATLALLLLAPAAAGVARLAARSRRLGSVLSARTTARQITASGAVVAILALAAGGAVLAGAALGTWRVAADATGVLIAGADARSTALAAGRRRCRRADGCLGRRRCGSRGAHRPGRRRRRRARRGRCCPSSPPRRSSHRFRGRHRSRRSSPRRSARHPSARRSTRGDRSAGDLLRDAERRADRATVPAADAYAGKSWFVDALGTPVSVPLEIVFTPLTWSEPIHPDPSNARLGAPRRADLGHAHSLRRPPRRAGAVDPRRAEPRVRDVEQAATRRRSIRSSSRRPARASWRGRAPDRGCSTMTRHRSR